MTKKVVGYFVWMRTGLAKPSPQKIDADIMTLAQPESIKRREEMMLDSHQLHAEEWSLPLEVLAERYPYKGKYEDEWRHEEEKVS